MINLRINAYLLLAGTIILLAAALLCSLAGNSLDIIFFGAGIFIGAICFKLFKTLRDEKKSRAY